MLIEQLSPELRRRFLNSTLQGLSSTPDQAREILGNWSHATIIEALEQAETNQLQVPRIMLDVLGKLGTQSTAGNGRRQLAAGTARNREQTAEQLTKLFRDGGIESYVPKDYSDALAVLAAADVATSLEPAQVEELLDNLNGHALERQFCAITLVLMELDVENRSVDVTLCQGCGDGARSQSGPHRGMPCHRIVSHDGSLGGFSCGLPLKRRLLNLEGTLNQLRNAQ